MTGHERFSDEIKRILIGSLSGPEFCCMYLRGEPLTNWFRRLIVFSENNVRSKLAVVR